MKDTITASNFADIMGVSKATLLKWENNGTFVPETDNLGNKFFRLDRIGEVPEIKEMLHSDWEEEIKTLPARPYTAIELFAGAGGLALGMSRILPHAAQRDRP